MNKSTKWIIWPVGIIGLIFSGLWSFIDLSEFYIVVIEKNTEEYPWGPVNTNPWYYANSQVYWIYCLISGLIFLLAFALILFGIIKLNLKRTILGVVITVLTITIMLISAAIVAPIA
ncbi:MAG: hypothetical protein KDD31_08135 [Muricauda sp.]|nr:hypothetical protein [Allomuricauda sp.]